MTLQLAWKFCIVSYLSSVDEECLYAWNVCVVVVYCSSSKYTTQQEDKQYGNHTTLKVKHLYWMTKMLKVKNEEVSSIHCNNQILIFHKNRTVRILQNFDKIFQNIKITLIFFS